MTNNPGQLFRNDASQKEREQVLRNDQRVRSGSTFQSRAIAEADDVRGRWAEINKSNVVGATPTPQYPAGPNWSVDPTGIEPPLNIDVNAVEPCGEKFEVEAFGDATEAVARSSPLAGATATPVSNDPSDTGEAEAPTAVPASPAFGEPPANQSPKRKGT
jgi:hypothetical protein